MDVVAGVRGVLARDMPLAFGFAMRSVIIPPFSFDASQVAGRLEPVRFSSTHSGLHHRCTPVQRDLIREVCSPLS
jgi:hypothetical protein